MSGMQVDVEELRLALKVTEEAAAEGRWDQSTWLSKNECGTAGCFAGSYALHCGMQPRWDEYVSGSRAARIMDEEGAECSVAAWAADRLGLDFDQQHVLFHGGNTLEDLREIVAEICAGAGQG